MGSCSSSSAKKHKTTHTKIMKSGSTKKKKPLNQKISIPKSENEMNLKKKKSENIQFNSLMSSKHPDIFGEEIKPHQRTNYILKTENSEDMNENELFSDFKKVEEDDNFESWIVNSKESLKQRMFYEINLQKTNKLFNLNAIKIVSMTNHMNIAKHFNYFIRNGKFCYSSDYTQSSGFFKRINGTYKEDEISCMIFQILKALNYLHNLGILHRNICPKAIIFLDDLLENKHNLVKISDFRYAKKINLGEFEKEILPHNDYQAPEIIRNQPYNDKSEVWSVGILMYLAIYKQLPFEKCNDETDFQKIDFPSDNLVSKEAISFLKLLLSEDVEKRPNAFHALNDIWFKKFKINQIFEIDERKILKMIKNIKKKSDILSNIRKDVKFFIIQNLNLSPELLEVYKTFEYFDINSDGKISKKELFNSFNSLFKKDNKNEILDLEIKKDIENVFSIYDVNNDGFISLEEFLVACLNSDILISLDSLELIYSFLSFRTNEKINLDSFDLIFSRFSVNEKNDIYRSHYLEFGLERDSFLSKKKFFSILKSLLMK